MRATLVTVAHSLFFFCFVYINKQFIRTRLYQWPSLFFSYFLMFLCMYRYSLHFHRHKAGNLSEKKLFLTLKVLIFLSFYDNLVLFCFVSVVTQKKNMYQTTSFSCFLFTSFLRSLCSLIYLFFFSFFLSFSLFILIKKLCYKFVCIIQKKKKLDFDCDMKVKCLNLINNQNKYTFFLFSFHFLTIELYNFSNQKLWPKGKVFQCEWF